MAATGNRVFEFVANLKDGFTTKIPRMINGMRGLGKASKNSGKQVKKSTKDMEGGLDRVSNKLEDIKSAAVAAFAAITGGAAVVVVNDTADSVANVAREAERLDVGVEALSKLGFAAKVNKVDFDQLTDALKEQTIKIVEADEGNQGYIDTFNALGLSVKDLRALKPEDAFLRIADATKALGDTKKDIQIFDEIYSDAGENLVRLAREGSAEIKRLGEEAKATGVVIDEKLAAASIRYSESLERMGSAAEGLKLNVLGPVFKELADFADGIGLGDRAKGLNAELIVLEDTLSLLETNKFLNGFSFDTRNELEEKIKAVKAELSGLGKTQREANEAAEKQERIAKRNQAVNKELATSTAEVTDQLDKRSKAAKSALDKETKELDKAVTDRASVLKRFDNLVEDITAPKTQDVGLIDVFTAINKAKGEAENGNFDDALGFADKGADLLAKLKEKGEDTGGTLGYLAEQLRAAADLATKNQVAVELDGVTKAKAELAEFDASLKEFKEGSKDMAKAGAASGIAFVKAFKDQINGVVLDIPINVQAISSDAVREGITQYIQQEARSPK